MMAWRKEGGGGERYKRKRKEYKETCDRKKEKENERWEMKVREAKREYEVWEDTDGGVGGVF